MEYTNDNRGKIQNRDRAKQLIDYSGLRFGKITPTDIDGLIEYHDKAVVLIEVKYDGAQVPRGQALAIMRLVDDCDVAGKSAVAFVCSHCVANCDEDINAADTIVQLVYFKKKWYHDGKNRLEDKARKFLGWVDELNTEDEEVG